MSDLPMPVPGSGAQLRMELMLALPRGWPGLDPLEGEALAREENFWPLRLLKDVARYPSSFDAYLSWGHTVDGSAGDLDRGPRSEEHTSELQSRGHLVCRLLLEKKK